MSALRWIADALERIAISMQMAAEIAGANICFVKRGSFMRYRTI